MLTKREKEQKPKTLSNGKTNIWSKEMENMNYFIAFGIFHGFSFEILVESDP